MDWRAEREALLAALAAQQRLAQAGLLVSTISHEVRNSLQIVFGALEVGLESEDPEDWRRSLETIREAAGSLADTNDALGGLLRRRDAAGRRRFPVRDLLRRAVRLVEPLAFDRGVALTLVNGCRGQVQGDFRLALQALLVLTSNAVRACPPAGGRVTVRASRPARRWCRIEVEDNGPPLPDGLEAGLERSFRAPAGAASEREFGLLLVREAVEALGGSVAAESSPPGVRFALDLPLRRAAC